MEMFKGGLASTHTVIQVWKRMFEIFFWEGIFKGGLVRAHIQLFKFGNACLKYFLGSGYLKEGWLGHTNSYSSLETHV